jgi:hypothetical protein
LLFVDRIATSVLLDFVPPTHCLKRPSRRGLPRRGRWCSWIASYALLTLAWPSLGLLPWVGMDLTATDHAAEQQTQHSHATPSSAAHEHPGNASDIPGSPTHPADHDCFQCRVLKHLSRCVPSALDPPTIALPSGCPVQPRDQLESQIAVHIAALPPARGPPIVIA